MFENMPLWPARASTMANNVDALYVFLLVVSALMSLAIFTMVVFFAVRYRKQAGRLPSRSMVPTRWRSPGR